MLFVQNQYQYLVSKSIHQEFFLVSQFSNQEFLLQFYAQVQGQRIVVLGSLTAPADQSIQLLLLVHALRQHGALLITLFSPYLGYQRQDKFGIGFSSGLQWADNMLIASGVNQIITIDPHNIASLSALKIPVVGYHTQIFFEEEMAYFVQLGFGFVFPDEGAYLRYSWIDEKFPQTLQGYFKKQRVHGIVQLQNFMGKVGRKVMIVDDILDSGQTLVQLCITLRSMGVEEIIIFVTHAFFYGQAWHVLWELGVKMLYCTDSLPAVRQIQHPQIHCKNISFLLQKLI